MDFIDSSDALFETAQSSRIQTIMLFYQHNLVTHSIGLIFYHNGIHYTKKKLDSELQDKEKINAVVPCRDMLKKALKLDQVHIFGDISMSQLLEKIDFTIERINFNQLKILILHIGSETSRQKWVYKFEIFSLGKMVDYFF